MRNLILGALALLLTAAGAVAGEWKKVVSPDELAAMAGSDVVVVDIRSAEAFAEGSVAGAVNAPYPSWRGPAENPGRVLSDAELTERLQSLGIEPDDSVVVVYRGANETDFGAAARVYWTLKSAGLTRIAILNGGIESYAKEGHVLVDPAGAVARSAAVYTLSSAWMIDRDGVASVLDGSRDAVMIDARPAAFWKGDKKHGAARAAGTLEGSLNLTHESWFSGPKTEILTGARVLEIARAAGYAPGGPELVSFCNTGHWAATNWFALSELAGIEGVKLYPESMVGWTLLGGAVSRGG